eukprot:3955384-Pyramimonas_sp.AAC.1
MQGLPCALPPSPLWMLALPLAFLPRSRSRRASPARSLSPPDRHVGAAARFGWSLLVNGIKGHSVWKHMGL